MPEIGSTLRDTRMRAGLDIVDVELATKIRAKYLRAIEEEQWDVLPGATFVRSFVRTYAEYLGLDAKLLLEEYRRRFEGPSELELAPISPNLGRDRRRPSPRAPRVRGPGTIIAGVIFGVLVLLLLLGLFGGNEPKQPEPVGRTPTSTNPAKPKAQRRPAVSPAKRARSTRVKLVLKATAPVWVCLQDAGQKRLVGGVVLEPGAKAQTFESKSFTVTFGNGNVDLRLNGKAFDVPNRSEPVGYSVTPKGAKELAAGKRPTCQ